jgi:hypothetical protein
VNVGSLTGAGSECGLWALFLSTWKERSNGGGPPGFYSRRRALKHIGLIPIVSRLPVWPNRKEKSAVSENEKATLAEISGALKLLS